MYLLLRAKALVGVQSNVIPARFNSGRCSLMRDQIYRCSLLGPTQDDSKHK